MDRVWDILIGTFMILAGLILQAAFLFIVVGLLAASFFKSNIGIWITIAVAAVLLNLLAWWEFRYKYREGGGRFFFVIRGIYRILYGRESYLPDTSVQHSELQH